MSYSTQIITESVLGKHNISEWVAQEISTINPEAIKEGLQIAENFLTRDHDELETQARIQEIASDYGLADASQLVLNALFETVILIKPELQVRGGHTVAYPGVAPIQAVATQIGFHLHRNQLDAVATGLDILAEFQSSGIFELRIVKEENRAGNETGIEIIGDSAVIIPTMPVSIELYQRIKFTKYLPPMLVQPQTLV